MKRSFSFYHLFYLLPLFVLYSNCDGYKGAGSNSNSSQACVSGQKLALASLNFSPEKDCRQLQNIKCETRVFKPSMINGEAEVQVCDSSKIFGETCLPLKILHFDTSVADGDEADFAEGGVYNYQEFNCYFETLTSHEEAIFSSSSDSLAKSLDQLYAQCTEAGQK